MKSKALIAGTIYILADIFIYAILLQKTTPIKILQSIASGIFKKEAYNNPQMAWYGLGFHFIIALIFAWFYFIVYPYVSFLKKSALLSGFLYGIFVWIVMNLIVLPIVFPVLPAKHFDFPLILSISILIICIGFPIAFIARKFYSTYDKPDRF
jgi:uncharacterized membrane protein YagU involved in acid resistance